MTWTREHIAHMHDLAQKYRRERRRELALMIISVVFLSLSPIFFALYTIFVLAFLLWDVVMAALAGFILGSDTLGSDQTAKYLAVGLLVLSIFGSLVLVGSSL